ncbi:MAG TPA: alpha/beta fold hydrolase [Mycobacteriales bacterium]|jgi:pimeloyl-ACP methyl ester carboxylesterase/putative sterol carrier protein|nr:alpha/beta fold hydrolase [Mycobacteriales bacterium]
MPRRARLVDAVRRRASAEATALADVDAIVAFDGGADARCAVELRHGAVTVTDWAEAPTTLISADAATLLDVVEGRTSGIEAFLDGRLRVDGDLSLSLRLDGLFGGEAADARPVRFPRAAMVPAGRIRTFHLEAGPPDALPVVLLHGLGATNASMLPTLWDLARDHHVLAPDLPGHGASAAPWGAYDARFFAAWLADYLDAVGVDRAVLVGNSLGGRVSLEIALLEPERVRGLVLLAPAVAFRRLRQFVPAVRLARPELAALPLPMTRGMARLTLRRMFSQPSRLTSQSYDAAAGEFVRVYKRPGYRVAFFSSLRQIYLDDAFGDAGFWRRLPDLKPPALFLWGARDRLVPAGFARHVAAAVPDATSIVLDDCGHVPQFELPDRTHEEVRRFLATLT